jgi:hypothetical protein
LTPGRSFSGASLILFLTLLSFSYLLGQRGIPVEDGGEIATVAALGGTCHPPGMPLLALAVRASRAVAGEDGLRLLFAAAASLSLWLIFRGTGAPGAAGAIAILVLPAFRERMLAWDAYGLLFLAFSAALSMRPAPSCVTGYLTGLASSIHPAGLMIPGACRTRWRSGILPFLTGLVLGLSVYLLLPLASSAGAVVDWGRPDSIGAFLRQVSAQGYREVYGASMFHPDAAALSRHLAGLWGTLAPALIVPVIIGTFLLARSDRRRAVTLALLVVLDGLFTAFVNPMAAGTSQTGWLSLCAFAAAASEAFRRLPRLPALLIAAGVAASGLLVEEPLIDQQAEVEGLLASAPRDAGLFISDNDLLYGSWMVKYVHDRRPDLALLSTGNFSPWFEELARRYAPGLDTSGGVDDAGGIDTPRDSVVARLVRLTISNNPGRRFFLIR